MQAVDNLLNPFDGEITDSQIEGWLDQFDRSERPSLLRLLPLFRYYSLRRFERLLRTLPEKIESAGNCKRTDLLYVPIGHVPSLPTDDQHSARPDHIGRTLAW